MRTEPKSVPPAGLERLAELADRHRVPGASLAIWNGDELIETAHGVANVDTGVEVTTDTAFQVGSITKLYTATLVMQLAEKGLLDLDSPVSRYLPGLRFADKRATASITVAHLLTHTSGLEGDHVVDCGRGADAVERYVATCVAVPSLYPPGEGFSYCNAGYVILGRLVEILTGRVWDDALRENLLGPLGVTATMTLPDEVILHRAAVGHIVEAWSDGAPTRADQWAIPRSMAPAAMICATARDVVEFARMHLDQGCSSDRTRILSAESVTAMQRGVAAVPEGLDHGLEGWGLGWMILRWGEDSVVGHDGGTIGQYAYLRIAPERDYAAALLTNCTSGEALARDLFAELFGEIGISVPEEPRPRDLGDTALGGYAGNYRRLHVELEVEEGDRCLLVTSRAGGPLESFWRPDNRLPLRWVGEHRFVGGQPPTAYVFSDLGSGHPTWLHTDLRAHRRVV